MSAIGQDNPAPDTGTSGANENAGDQPELDYQRAYSELRPQYTRTTQELAQERERLSEYEALFQALHDSDPEVQAAAMEALGLELDTGSPATDDEFADPLEEELQQIRGVVDELRSARELEASEKESQQLTQMRDQYIDEAIDYIRQSTDAKFTDREEEALGNLAIAMEDEQGLPDVQGAYNLLYGDDGVLETNRERWIASKTGAAQAPLGRSLPADQKPQTRAERIAYLDERMRAIDMQQ